MRIILAHTSIPSKALLRRLPSEGCGGWVYVGRNFRRLREFELWMPVSIQRVQLGAAIQKQAMDLRRPFLQFMSEQMLANDPAVAWSSCMFENNTVQSPLFLHLCSLAAIESYLRESSLDFLLIVVEQAEMLAFLSRNLPAGSGNVQIEITWRETAHRAGSWLRAIAVILARPISFVRAVLRERRLTRQSRQGVQGGSFEGRSNGAVLLRTWVEEASFDKDGLFQDRYLPSLAEWLTGNGFPIVRLPVLSVGCLGSPDVMKHLRNPKNAFVVPWDYLRPRDLVETLWVGFRQCGIVWNKDTFEGWDLGPLLKAERRRYALARRGLFGYLNGLLIRRLKASAVRVTRCIYTFENMLPEKLFVRAFKLHFPDIPLIGFQHSALYPLKLDLYVDGRHLSRLPLPDRVVCSGPLFREILFREYAPFRQFEDGPALRFAHLFKTSSEMNRHDRSTVLVVLPGYLNEATELMGKVIDALRADPLPYPVVIKPHPTMSEASLRALIEELGGSSLPLEIVTEPLSRLFQSSGAVITIASSVLLDALAAGIPVVRVRRESDLDMDPLDWMDFPKAFSFQATSATELGGEIRRAMSLTDHQQAELRTYATSFVESGMGSLSDERFAVFVH